MSNDLVIYLSKQLLWHGLLIASPVVIATTVFGFIFSIFQVATQIQDSSLSLIPKMLAALFSLMFCSEWMLRILIDFSKQIFINIPGSLT